MSEQHNAAAAGPGAAKPSGYRYVVLAMLILAYTFNFLDRQILGILAKPIKDEFHLTDGQFGLMGGLAFALLYTTLAIPIAWLADRFSRVWIMTAALTLWSGFTALCGFVGGFGQLFLARMGVGIGEAGGVAPAYSLIADYFPKQQRARALAAYAFGIPLGTAAGTLVGGLLAVRYGWRSAFVVVGALGVLLAPLFRLVMRDPPRGGADREAGAPVAPPAPAAPLGEVVRLLAAKPSFWLLALGAASSSVCGYGVAAWLPSFFIRSLGLTLAQTAWYYSGIAFIGGLLGIWLGGAMADRLGAKSKGAYPLTPAVAFVISVPCFLLAMNSGALVGGLGGQAALAVAFVIFLIPTGLNLTWLGPITAAVQHLAPAPMRTTASALFLLINNLLGIAVGVYYFGLVSDLLKPTFGAESLRWAIYTGMGFYLLAALLFLLASRRLARDWVE
ncbi:MULTISPECIES: MFS transporter [Caulobacter]|jgi:MFS family permease|uniref:Sugar phosphate permease n=1 Tax=Caulobacter vibrioides OR37 TaxID=1292034 RepID=R0D0J1_CAUVI|nr:MULTISPECIES: MFS transporter [Caulobacter]ENZ82010.1 sugar phosphate permease [Caulobacter vibrioides OR37]MBQ1560975.1 MFS transporter [Caulobacter sp.]